MNQLDESGSCEQYYLQVFIRRSNPLHCIESAGSPNYVVFGQRGYGPLLKYQISNIKHHPQLLSLHLTRYISPCIRVAGLAPVGNVLAEGGFIIILQQGKRGQGREGREAKALASFRD
jgi:hypothetical protein